MLTWDPVSVAPERDPRNKRLSPFAGKSTATRKKETQVDGSKSPETQVWRADEALEFRCFELFFLFSPGNRGLPQSQGARSPEPKNPKGAGALWPEG